MLYLDIIAVILPQFYYVYKNKNFFFQLDYLFHSFLMMNDVWYLCETWFTQIPNIIHSIFLSVLQLSGLYL